MALVPFVLSQLWVISPSNDVTCFRTIAFFYLCSKIQTTITTYSHGLSARPQSLTCTLAQLCPTGPLPNRLNGQLSITSRLQAIIYRYYRDGSHRTIIGPILKLHAPWKPTALKGNPDMSSIRD
ncbi:hypothetical protein H2248_011096 [Termitomyces sp. 'cryptogamus']|nr:hypothetical protein H2248_011096 [Termitomyces sp. 'cryptogamus']